MKRRYNTDRDSFIAITIAWALGLICFSVTQVLKNGKTEDFEPVIFWSIIFTLTAWLIFIRIPLNRINPSSWIFNKFIFPLLTSIYGLIVFVILIGWGFINFYEVFIQAGAMGLIFGLVYNSVTVKRLKTKREKTIWHLTPIIILTMFLWVYPTVLPAAALRFMPDSIESQIIKRTIKDFKIGDDFSDLKKRLPGHFDDTETLELSKITGLRGLRIFGAFQYRLIVHCGKIIQLEYSEKEHGYKEFSQTDGRIFNEPCP